MSQTLTPHSSTSSAICECGFVAKNATGLKIHRGKSKCADRPKKNNPGLPTGSAPSTPINDDFIEHLQSLKQGTHIIHRIPKAARIAASESLNKIILDCISRNDFDSWKRLLLFSHTTFCLPDKKKRKESLTSVIKQNIHRSNATLVKKDEKKAVNRSDEALRKSVEQKISDGDVSGAVRLLSSEDGIAPNTIEVLEILRSKHPPTPLDLNYPDEPACDEETDFAVTSAEVYEAVKSFPNGSAGGVDGMRPQHLKDLLGGLQSDISARLCQSLSSLMELMLKGKVPDEVSRILYGASLTALKKKDGGIRPVAVGLVLRRVCGKIVSKRLMKPLGEILRPVQLGYGTKGGAEAAVHAARAFLLEETDTPRVLLKLDFRNAFNAVRRDIVLQEASEYIPRYAPFIDQLYKKPSVLFFGEHKLSSESGVQQGDPLGPLLFCLATRRISAAMISELNIWYLDDATLGGDVLSVCHDLRTVLAEASKVGLELNLSKCEVFITGGSEVSQRAAMDQLLLISPQLKPLSSEELTLLGSPVLSPSIPDVLEEKSRMVQILCDRLAILQSHQALFLLKNCFCIPKLLYVLRCSPAWQCVDRLQKFDNTVKAAVEKVTNVRMSEDVWLQASFPVRNGGLGIRKAEELALPAYLASVHSVSSLIQQILPSSDMDDISAIAVLAWKQTVNSDVPAGFVAGKQRNWDEPLVARKLSNLLERSAEKDKARLLGASTKESGSWLNALPSSFVGNLLDDDSLRISVALRLGSTICEAHTCRCGTSVDCQGLHGLSCKFSAGRFSRHSSLNDVVKRALASASIPAHLEPPGLEMDGKRPDGMTLVPWKNGQALVWDVTCVDTMAKSHLSATSKEAGKAAENAELRKMEKYRRLEGRYHFEPLGFETIGAWGPAAKDLVQLIGRKVAERTGEPRSLEFLRQRISIEIQRGNAFSVLGTLPTSKGIDEIYYVLSRQKPVIL